MHQFFTNVDTSISAFMAGYNQQHLTVMKIFSWITNVGGTEVMAVLGILVTLGLAFQKKWVSAAIMFCAVGSTAVIVLVLKNIFMRVRPDNALLLLVNDPSFPSGHAALSAAFFVVVAYFLLQKNNPSIWRKLAVFLCVLIIIVVGLSRLILNVHWASDVIAGWSIGLFCSAVSILVVRAIGSSIAKKV